MSEYDGRHYGGIDVHRRRSVLVRMAEDGQRLETTRISNDPEYLRSVMARAGEAPEVVLEACYGWYWAADTLAECGANVHLAHPLEVKGFAYRRVENDELDAADLADLLRMGRLPEAWIAPPSIRELRELVRHRAKLVGLRTNLKCQVHAVLASAGIAVAASDLFGVAGAGWTRPVRGGDGSGPVPVPTCRGGPLRHRGLRPAWHRRKQPPRLPGSARTEPPHDQAELTALRDRNARLARQCSAADPLAAHLGVAQVAADVEDIRRALGGEPLNWYGASYGTEIGQA